MKKEWTFDFNVDKNKKLLANRGVCFEQVIFELNADREFAFVEHPKR